MRVDVVARLGDTIVDVRRCEPRARAWPFAAIAIAAAVTGCAIVGVAIARASADASAFARWTGPPHLFRAHRTSDAAGVVALVALVVAAAFAIVAARLAARPDRYRVGRCGPVELALDVEPVALVAATRDGFVFTPGGLVAEHVVDGRATPIGSPQRIPERGVIRARRGVTMVTITPVVASPAPLPPSPVEVAPACFLVASLVIHLAVLWPPDLDEGIEVAYDDVRAAVWLGHAEPHGIAVEMAEAEEVAALLCPPDASGLLLFDPPALRDPRQEAIRAAWCAGASFAGTSTASDFDGLALANAFDLDAIFGPGMWPRASMTDVDLGRRRDPWARSPPSRGWYDVPGCSTCSSRGSDVRSRRVDVRVVGRIGGLDPATIRRYLLRHARRLEVCYDQAVLDVELVADLVIDPEGKVASRDVSGPATLAGCVAGVIASIRFAIEAESTRTRVLFTFHPDRR